MKKLTILLLLLPFLAMGQSYTITGFTKGFVVLKSGERKDGQVGYRISTPDGDTTLVRFKAGKFKEKYTPDQLSDFGSTLLISDMKNNYGDESKNFHPGYIFLSDGQKIEGRVAGRKKEPHESQYKNFGPLAVKFANEQDEVILHWANRKTVVYYVQIVGGKEHHYINLYDYFVKVENPDGRFSYFKNPLPTHINESATNLSKSMAAMVEQQATEIAAKAAAKKSFEVSQQKGIDQAVGNAAVAAMNAAETVQDVFRVENMEAIVYKEYFIVDNKNKTRSVVYKENIDDVLNAILDGCGLQEKIVNKVGKIKELPEVMIFLEENACD